MTRERERERERRKQHIKGEKVEGIKGRGRRILVYIPVTVLFSLSEAAAVPKNYQLLLA